MKSILISIKPKWVAKILNGEKTIEIRKKFPKDYVGWVYIYCTKDNHQLVKPKDYDKYLLFTKGAVNYSNEQTLNGKVISKFILNKVDRYVNGCKVAKKYPMFNDFEKILTPACIYTDELENYCEDLSFYAWHISNLVIFDRPKELSEFKQPRDSYGKVNWNTNEYYYVELTKAPQSWCYVEVLL